MTQTLFPSEIANVISGIIIYLCAFSGGIQKLIYKGIAPKKANVNAVSAEETVSVKTETEAEVKKVAAEEVKEEVIEAVTEEAGKEEE